MTEPTTQTLIEMFNQLWSEGGVKIAVLNNATGLLLPAEVKKLDSIVLHYPLHPVVPIHDLKVDNDGIRATLSFNRTPFPTFVPWSAVLGMMSLYGPDSAVLDESPAPPKTKTKARHLKAV